MEFLDEQGVEPCGHKAREKGMLVKVFASCKSYEIPTEYRYSMNGIANDKNTGEMEIVSRKQLLDTQTTDGIDFSSVLCSNMNIDEPCTLEPGFSWSRIRAANRIRLINGIHRGDPAWWYILLEDDDYIQNSYEAVMATGGSIDFTKYGQILKSGFGEDPPKDVKAKINKDYPIPF